MVRRLFSFFGLFSLILLGACGFTPIYGSGGAGLGTIQIANIESRTGYFMQQILSQHAAQEAPSADIRTLKIVLKTTFGSAAQGTNGVSFRTRINYTANWTLESDDKKISGTATAEVAFNASSSPYSEVTLQQDAEERGANMLAEQIWSQLINKARIK